jgi:hypothetical protein
LNLPTVRGRREKPGDAYDRFLAAMRDRADADVP